MKILATYHGKNKNKQTPVLICLFGGSHSLMSSLERPSPRLGLVNFRPLHLFWLVFYWHLHLLAFCRPLSKGHKLSSHFRLLYREQIISVSARSVHAPKISDLQFFFSDFRLCYSPITVCFIYLFIYLLIYSIFYEAFNYVTYLPHENPKSFNRKNFKI